MRYADDFVVGFQHVGDARRFQAELGARLRKFCLELHPEKTRLIRFGRFAALNREERGLGKPETFTFLGLRHICAQTKAGKFLLKRISDMKRQRAKLQALKRWLPHARILHPYPEQRFGVTTRGRSPVR